MQRQIPNSNPSYRSPMKFPTFWKFAVLAFTLAACDAGVPEEGTPAAGDPTMPAASGIDMGEGAGMGTDTSGTVPVRVPADQPNSPLGQAEGRDTTTDIPSSGADTAASGIR